MIDTKNDSNKSYQIKNYIQSYGIKNNHIAVYLIRINNYVYVGETLNIIKRINEHINDLTNNTHKNKMLQQEFNKTQNLDNVYFYILYTYRLKYSRLEKSLNSEFKDFDIYNNINNLYKLVLICIENYVIEYFKNNKNYICCNKEKTIDKIYYNLHNNNNKELFLKYYQQIILFVEQINSIDKYKIKYTKNNLYYSDRRTIQKICDILIKTNIVNIFNDNNIFLLQQYKSKYYFN